MNLLNQEIMCIRQTIAEKKKIMDSEKNPNVKENLRHEIMVLQIILNDKLSELLDLEEGIMV